MKKTLFAIFLSLLLVLSLTACKKSGGSVSGKQTITCTKEGKDDDGNKTKQTVTITYVNSKIKSLNSETIMSTDPKYIDMVIAASSTITDKLNSIEGLSTKYVKANQNEIKVIMDIDYTKLDLKKLQETLGKLYSKEDTGLYNLKDVTIDDIKTEMKKSGYSCD